MTNAPWGPHGPQVPPNTVTPNPTAPTPPQPMEGSGAGWTPPLEGGGGGGGGGLGDVLANIVISLILVALLWIPLACLYPLTALAGAAIGLAAYPVLLRSLPPDGHDVAAVAAIIAAVATALVVNRTEYRLAKHPAFRLGRHVVRLLLLAVWAIPVIQLAMGATAPTTSTRYILAMVSSPRALGAFLSRPQNLLLWLVIVAGLHYLIWSAQGFRNWWHRRLLFVGFK